MSNTSLNSIERICRACLNADVGMLLIFEYKYNDEEVAALITECTKYRVYRSDKLPQFICQACLKSLYSAVAFKRKYEHNQQRLMLLTKTKAKEDVFTSIEKFTQTDETSQCSCKHYPAKFPSSKPNQVIALDNLNLHENVFNLVRNDFESNGIDSLCTVDTKDSLIVDRTNKIEEQHLIVEEYPTEHDNEEKERSISDINAASRKRFVAGKSLNNYEGEYDSMQLPVKCRRGRPPKQIIARYCDDSHQIHQPVSKYEADFDNTTDLEHHKSAERRYDESICKICSLSFPSTNLLKRMQENSNAKKCINCCGSSKQTKYNHHFKGENKDKLHKCESCSKQFTTKINLKKHMARHCSKHFKCKECGKNFDTKFELQRHTKSESHDKPLLCPECGLRCKTNNTLLVHMRRHNGEKPFKCKFCSKGFPRMDDLRVHEKYHTGEKSHFCEICGKGFQRKYNLTIHLRVHTGEKPYKCPHCPQAFAQGNDLKCHIRRHTGERFHCELCDAAFLQGYQIRNHKLMEHGIKEVPTTQRVTKFTSPQEQKIKEAHEVKNGLV